MHLLSSQPSDVRLAYRAIRAFSIIGDVDFVSRTLGTNSTECEVTTYGPLNKMSPYNERQVKSLAKPMHIVQWSSMSESGSLPAASSGRGCRANVRTNELVFGRWIQGRLDVSISNSRGTSRRRG